MITKTKQNWTVGNTVKVGFLSLIVKAAIATPGDYAPDAYILNNQAGTQLYKFVPHNGLEKISNDAVRLLIAEQKYRAASIALGALAQLQANNIAAAEIEALFAA